MKNSQSKKPIRAVPEGFHTVNTYLTVENASGLIEFIKKAFNGEETFNMKHPDGKVMHASVRIGDSTIMISDVMDDMQPQTAMLYLYVEDVDKLYEQAIAAKGTSIREPRDEFYGDRAGAVKDNFGNTWWIARQIENVDQDELERRSKEAMKERKEKGHEVHA
jgi:PhnB protein